MSIEMHGVPAALMHNRLALTALLALSTFVSPSSQTSSEVFYIANEGFLIASGGRKVLIDALVRTGIKPYAVASPQLKENLENARGAFEGVDLVLATHYHADHFDPLTVAEHLSHNPNARFVSSNQAVQKLKSASANFDAIKSRVTGVHPKEGERVELTHRGVNLKVLNIHHGRDVPIENLGFIIEMDGRTFLHIVWMHIPPFDQKDDYVESRGGWAKVLGDARAAFPAAVYFEREMERKAFD